MKVLIIEDELPNQRLLEGMIVKLRPGWKIVGLLESVRNAVSWLTHHDQPDLIFMDIQLADGICFSIFAEVEVKSMVIFTTAYDTYAIQAFKVNSIDYLLKPVKETDLEKAICKFEKFTGWVASSDVDYTDILHAIRSGEKKYRKRFLISGRNAFYTIKTSEIAYFISEKRITTAVTFNNKKHVVDFTLEELEEELNPECYFRANRQAIVHIESVKKIEDYFGGKLICKLMPEFQGQIIISRLKASAFKEWMGK